DAIRAVQTLLNTFAEEGSRPWIVLHPFTSVDPASREVVALATLRAQVGSFVIANVPEDTALPKGLEKAIRADVTLVPLTGGQRLAASRALFGPTTEAEIIERVAALGDTPLGVLEAARMLIGRGDIVFHDDRFIWRHKPQHFAATVPVGALIEDRLSALAPVERRILEVVAVAPSGAPNELLWDIMTRDGVDGATALDAISHLRDGAFLQPDDPLQATSAVLRGVIFEATEPVRIAELQRLVAEALHASGIQGFPAGSLGFYLYESGDHANAARALLHAGAHASRAGFMRAAMRLAAAGVQFDPSPETRAEAASITQSMPPPGMPRTSASAPPSSRPAIEENQLSGANTLPPTGDLGRKAIDAILSGNFDAADHTIDVAIAEGCNPQAADRLRAMAHLVRGDVATAVQLLAQSKEGPAADDRARVRYGVAKTLVLLHSGRPLAAMRAGLRALGAARALDDLDGERAAMHAVASA
ncbi:MAG: hypothetical protein KC417_16275, partial [Myxococcales bacterium]|nr:hypothetical protein [Myxococcales bacterium]